MVDCPVLTCLKFFVALEYRDNLEADAPALVRVHAARTSASIGCPCHVASALNVASPLIPGSASFAQDVARPLQSCVLTGGRGTGVSVAPMSIPLYFRISEFLHAHLTHIMTKPVTPAILIVPEI